MTHESLIEVQKADASLTNCFAGLTEVADWEKAHSFYAEDGLLMWKWVSQPMLRQEGLDKDRGTVHQFVVPTVC